MRLDDKDRAILLYLESDSRIPISHLAKKVGLSKDGAAYRLKRMEEGGVIGGFYTAFDVPKLGLIEYRVNLKLQNASPKKESEMVGFLKGGKSVVWVGSCDGRWDLAFTAWTRSADDLDSFLTKFLGGYGQFVQERDVGIATESHSCRRKYLLPCKPEESVYSGPPAKGRIDEIDTKIIHLMADNARIRLKDVANDVGMAQESVSHRIRALLQKGIVQGFRPVINPASFDRRFYSVMVRLNSTKRIDDIFSFLKGQPDTIHYSKCSGSFDFWFDLEVESPEKLREIMWEIRARFSEEIRNFEPLLVYNEHKRVHSPS